MHYAFSSCVLTMCFAGIRDGRHHIQRSFLYDIRIGDIFLLVRVNMSTKARVTALLLDPFLSGATHPLVAILVRKREKSSASRSSEREDTTVGHSLVCLPH